MWVADKSNIKGRSDSRIVREGFVIASGETSARSFLERDKKRFRVPVYYIHKVNRHHPLRVFSSEPGHVGIGFYNEKDSFSSGKDWASAHYPRAACFIMVPSNIEASNAWDSFRLGEGGYADASGNRGDAVLFYANGPITHTQDTLYVHEQHMPSMLVKGLFDWMTSGGSVYFDRKKVGKVEVPFDRARELYPVLTERLEKDLKRTLSFPKKIF